MTLPVIRTATFTATPLRGTPGPYGAYEITTPDGVLVGVVDWINPADPTKPYQFYLATDCLTRAAAATLTEAAEAGVRRVAS